MNVCSINQFEFFWSIYPRSISPVLFFLILNISLKVLPVYVYVLSYKGLLLLKVPIFLMPHILWFHKSVLACWVCSHIKSLALCIFLCCLLSFSKLTFSFSSWLELTMWAPFPKEFEYAPWVRHAKIWLFFPFSSLFFWIISFLIRIFTPLIGSCYSVSLRDNHLCVENSMRHHCPICYEVCFLCASFVYWNRIAWCSNI